MGRLVDIAKKIEGLEKMYYDEIVKAREEHESVVNRHFLEMSEEEIEKDEAEPLVEALRKLQQRISECCWRLNVLYEEYKL